MQWEMHSAKSQNERCGRMTAAIEVGSAKGKTMDKMLRHATQQPISLHLERGSFTQLVAQPRTRHLDVCA